MTARSRLARSCASGAATTRTRFEQFRAAYIEELRAQRPRLAALRARARDPDCNHAVVLAEVLRRGLPRIRSRAAGPAWTA